jgi:hypothetical protein
MLGPVVGLDLILQYISGLGTNVYAPDGGFNMNTDFGFYDLHAVNGDILGILSILLVIFAVFSRKSGNYVPAIIFFVAVLVAGIAGMVFANDVPNPPLASLTMGLAFLVAFATGLAITFRQMMIPAEPMAPSGGAPSA